MVSSPHITSSSPLFAENELRDLSTGRVQRAIRTFRQIGIQQLIRMMCHAGWRENFGFLARNVRHLVAHRAALLWDRRYGVDTAGSIQLHSLSISGPNREFGNECVCTSPNTFDFMMRSLPIDLSGYTFVDIGAGKSRTLLLASRYNFSRIVGVEFARELVDCSRRNIGAFRGEWQRCCNLHIVEADAAQFEFPPTPLLIYLYNPFARPVFDTVLGNVVESLKAKPRDCVIIYGSSSHNSINWARPMILASGLFAEVPSEPMPFFFDAVRTVGFAVFRTR